MSRWFTLGISTLVALLVSGVASAQDPAAPDPDAVLSEVAEQARADVADGLERQGVQDLELLYGERARRAGLERTELLETYRGAYKDAQDQAGARAESAQVEDDPWSAFVPDAGWVVAGLLFVVLLLRDQLKTILSRLIAGSWELVYARLAGSKLLRRSALRRYRAALRSRYERLKIPFRPERPLDMREVFTPLRIVGGEAEGEDVELFLRQHRRLVTLGPPGAGKSMLLRSVVLAYADGRLRLPDAPVPVLVELGRLDAGGSIEAQIVKAFAANDFPGAERFVRAALASGQLLLLFDGLDEVDGQRRPKLVAELRELFAGRCPIMVTCRTQVYRQEFLEDADATLEIQDLVDRQIQRFLGSWERFLPAEKSIEQLLGALYDRPRILALARNPLLLTIIAYLYTDTDLELPHSRAEFYDRAVDVLLRQWKQARNAYGAADKRHVLEHVALFNQSQVGEDGDERLFVARPTMLAQIAKALPGVNLGAKDAAPMLDEIVERSGLLLELDGGERYAFAHLSLQEFFAAAALKADAGALVLRFGEDPELWREVVKLWCGLGLDASEVVAAVHGRDPFTAYECLADAQRLGPELWRRLLAELCDQLGRDEDQRLASALGSIAASDRRGREAFSFLRELLSSNEDRARREAAARALSFTQRREAAALLAGCLDLAQARTSLVRMGDVAVGPLIHQARAGSAAAFEDLRVIGTPRAAVELATLLWDEDEGLAGRAAWTLAALLPEAGVEDALRELELSAAQAGAPSLSWAWAPFEEPHTSALPLLAGRVAHVMARTRSPWRGQSVSLEPRLVIPVLIDCLRSDEVDLSGQSGVRVREAFAECGRRLEDSDGEGSLDKLNVAKHADLVVESVEAGHLPSVATESIVDGLVGACPSPDKVSDLVAGLRAPLDLIVLSSLSLGRRPEPQDWKDLRNPAVTNFEFGSSWQVSVAGLLAVALTVAGLVGGSAALAGAASWGFKALVLVSMLLAGWPLARGVVLAVRQRSVGLVWITTGFIASLLAWMFQMSVRAPDRWPYLTLFSFYGLLYLLPTFFVLTRLFPLLLASAGEIVSVIVIIYAAIQGLTYWAHWLAHKSANPLHRLLAGSAEAPRAGASALASALGLGPGARRLDGPGAFIRAPRAP